MCCITANSNFDTQSEFGQCIQGNIRLRRFQPVIVHAFVPGNADQPRLESRGAMQRVKFQRGGKAYILNDIFRVLPVLNFEMYIALKRDQILLQ